MDLRIDNPYIYKVKLSKEAKSEIKALQDQNKSLRETIHAQSKVLVSADNAIKTAERLLSENTILQRRLQQVESCSNNLEENPFQEEVARLKKENEELKELLDNERKSGIADRVKIQQYKKEEGEGDFDLEKKPVLKTCESNENISRKISLYKSTILYLEAGIELKNKEIDLLKLENQDLGARINLACKN